MKIWLSTEIVDEYQQWKKVPERFVALEDHQAEVQTMREWKDIITGTGVDQESVIRMVSVPYVKLATACWREKVEELESKLDLAMGEAVKWADLCRECWVSDANQIAEEEYDDATHFLSSPEVQAWRERQKEKVK